ncbi:MAG: UMP kinase [Nitrososphaerota archaeon]|nr:UMP kinase [Candidatus Termiticorpusculum sp.]MCL2292434.1 UMP kinase [Candidatus Termiticorpusculum sp.]MDR0461647.1 UMP kinase [Nitrososphaerota archaeon]
MTCLVVRIGGSVIASPVNTDLIGKYADLIREIKLQGHKVAVILGGGTLAREFIGIAKNLTLESAAQDRIAISVSRLYAQLFMEKLGSLGYGKVVTTLDEAEDCFSQGKIVVMGGLKPGHTTDTVGALVAERLAADLLVKGTDQEGVYTKDPRKFADAVKLGQMNFDDLSQVLECHEHKVGIHQVIDSMAIDILKRNHVKLIVFNGFKPENLLLAAEGKQVGTVIS